MKATQNVLDVLQGVQKQGGGWLAFCPSHEDRRRSLSINEGSDRVLVFCHAGCDHAKVVASVGLTERDLFDVVPDPSSDSQSYKYTVGKSTQKIKTRKPRKSMSVTGPDGSPGKPGDAIDHLYQLPELLGSPKSEPVLFVEGEKGADAVRLHGFVGVATGGVNGWRPEFAPALRGRHVVLLPDNDPPGEVWTRTILEDVVPVAESVRVCRLPVPEKGDVYDFLATLPDDQDSREALLDRIALATEETKPEPKPEPGMTLVKIADLPDPGPREYVTRHILPTRAVTSLFGPGGTRKSYLATAWGLHVCVGRPFLDLPVKQGAVVYVDAELDSDEMRRRAGWLARGMGLSTIPDGFHYIALEGSLREPENVDRLRRLVARVRPVLVIVDSWEFAFMEDPRSAGRYTARDAVAVCKILIDLAEAALVLDHTSAAGAAAGEKPHGSIFKINGVRSAVRLFEGTNGALILEHAKANFSKKLDPLGLRMVFDGDDEIVNAVQLERIDPNDPDLQNAKGGTLSAGTRIEDLLRDSEPMTPKQIADELDLPVVVVRARLHDLKNSGAVRKDGRSWTTA